MGNIIVVRVGTLPSGRPVTEGSLRHGTPPSHLEGTDLQRRHWDPPIHGPTSSSSFFWLTDLSSLLKPTTLVIRNFRFCRPDLHPHFSLSFGTGP